jgi:hypothetical protein
MFARPHAATPTQVSACVAVNNLCCVPLLLCGFTIICLVPQHGAGARHVARDTWRETRGASTAFFDADAHRIWPLCRPTEKDEQVVVLSQILMDQVNYGYEGVTPAIVKAFNGQKVLNLESLMQMVLASKDEYLRFELDDDNASNVVMRREAAVGRCRTVLFNLMSVASLGF